MRSLVLIVFSLLICSNCSAVAAEKMSKVSFSQVPYQVRNVAKSLDAPPPRFKELGMVSFTQGHPKNISYGHYRVDAVTPGLTKLTMIATQNFKTEDVTYSLLFGKFTHDKKFLNHELRSNSSAISVDGVIELLGINTIHMKTSNNIKLLPIGFSNSMTFESKTIKLEKVSGHLFPLKVGNELIIRRSFESSAEKGMKRTIISRFEVTKKIKGYLINNSVLPGNVFEITMQSEQAIKNHIPPATLLFSSHLGWVVESHIGNTVEEAVGWK